MPTRSCAPHCGRRKGRRDRAHIQPPAHGRAGRLSAAPCDHCRTRHRRAQPHRLAPYWSGGRHAHAYASPGDPQCGIAGAAASRPVRVGETTGKEHAMRGDGLYRRGEVWWMTWRTPDGKRHRASTEKHYHEEAKAVRDRLAGDVASNRPVILPGKVTLHDLKELIVADYKAKRRRSLGRLKGALEPLIEFFGRRPVASISWGDTLKYRQHREAQGRAMATVNYELAALRRMCRLGVKDGKLSMVPVVETPDPKNARSGFF